MIDSTCPNDAPSNQIKKLYSTTIEKEFTGCTKWLLLQEHMMHGEYVCDFENPCAATKST